MIFLFSYISICRLFPDSSERGKEPVDMRPDQEKIEAEIKPEHYDDDCGKAAMVDPFIPPEGEERFK